MWITETGKDVFEKRFAAKLAAWRLAPEHEGFCVIASAEWADLTPVEIMERFETDTLDVPLADSSTRLVGFAVPCPLCERAFC